MNSNGQKYHGIFPVLYAFFDKDGNLDPVVMKKQVDYCIDNGAHGITVLGLVTEVHKMDVNERIELVKMVGELIAKRVPYFVTVAESTIHGQIAFSKAAQLAGADLVILQPPPIKGVKESDVIEFFGEVAKNVDIDVAVQNNPVNLDVSLSVTGLINLSTQFPNISILKGEGYSVDIASVITASKGSVGVFGGHGGIEFMSLLRSGGVGLIPAPDFLIPQVKIFNLWQKGDDLSRQQAEKINKEILPAIVFMSRTVPGMLCYGKRLFAKQIGITEIFERPPYLNTTDFGLTESLIFEEFIQNAVQNSKIK